MRVIHAASTRRCYACQSRADVVVGRGYRHWYSCWEHAPALLEAGGVLVAGDLEPRAGDRSRRR